MIDYILQIDGQNMLQVVYKSGTNRYIFPNGWGHYEPNMTKTQRDFYNNSFCAVMINAGGWGRKVYYWLDRNNPNKAVLSAIGVKNELYGGIKQ